VLSETEDDTASIKISETPVVRVKYVHKARLTEKKVLGLFLFKRYTFVTKCCILVP